MRILAASDTHGHIDYVLSAMDRIGEIDLVVHAGDYVRDVRRIMAIWPHFRYEFVCGNGDAHEGGPQTKEIEMQGVKIFLTHGHGFSVKCSDALLLQAAKRCGAQIAIYGHTHQPIIEKKEGIYLINPGGFNSGTTPSVAIIEIEHTKVGACLFQV